MHHKHGITGSMITVCSAVVVASTTVVATASITLAVGTYKSNNQPAVKAIHHNSNTMQGRHQCTVVVASAVATSK